MDLEGKVICYVGDTMSPYMTDAALSKLVEHFG